MGLKTTSRRLAPVLSMLYLLIFGARLHAIELGMFPEENAKTDASCEAGPEVASTLTCGDNLGDVSNDSQVNHPNIVFILTDDHRWDSYCAAESSRLNTPNLDRIAERGTRFTNAFVTLAICSPSRAACLTGRYGSANGVTTVGNTRLREGERTFAHDLADAGYATGVTGKWHLKTTPKECGFQFASTCWSNGTWYDRKFLVEGNRKVMPGFVDDVAADESIRFIRQAAKVKKPFALWMCTQVPHMDHRFKWPAQKMYLERHVEAEMPLPQTWNDDLSGKPEYLKTSRSRSRALAYGYDQPENIRRHVRDYRASVEQMDASVGRVLAEIRDRGLDGNTWVIFMGDNGWFLGEHGFTSKVLPYEESMRVPMAICGPGTKPLVSDELVLNIDLTATIYELAGLPVPAIQHGQSLLPIVQGATPGDWRSSFLYEAPTEQLGSRPLWAVRDARWKYVETHLEDQKMFRELYDLKTDAVELKNVVDDDANSEVVRKLSEEMFAHREAITVSKRRAKTQSRENRSVIPESPPKSPRTDLFISGVYPHLTTYGVYSQNGAHYKNGHNECGIGAVVPWAGKLWMVNYAPHMPEGSEHKLYSIDADLGKPMTVHSESVGGTPAGRMIHEESNQLFIAHYAIDASGKVRVIQPKDMPIRVTAITRHLTDPANKVYYVDMEGSIWEANVHTLAVKRLFRKPVPGWHGKGGYVSQGRLVVSNNGELHVGDYRDVLVGGKAKTPEERGVLAEYDGRNWSIVERRQFTEVTGPRGITGGSDGNDPIWTMGWDRRSVRLKVLDNGEWHTYLLPKAAYCNDASHGWYTEWPRIRQITEGRWMMDMHGMFFDFPKTFSASNSSGIKPIGSHLRYIPDFCEWNGRLVLASDETSIQGNPLAGQPQSNLWFGDYEDLRAWGPASGYGGPWIEDRVAANTPSDPFLVAGFDRRVLHLAVGAIKTPRSMELRTTDQQEITDLPDEISMLPRVTVDRGDWRKPAVGFSFRISSPATVYVAVDGRGKSPLTPEWKRTNMTLTWGKEVKDAIYARQFSAGTVLIPGSTVEHHKGAFGMPHIAFVRLEEAELNSVSSIGNATVTRPSATESIVNADSSSVSFTVQVDREGNGSWVDLEVIELPFGEAIARFLPADLDATWLRLITDRECVASAILHQTAGRHVDGDTDENKALFAGLLDVGDNEESYDSLIYPAKRNRDLRVVTHDGRHFDFTKAGFEYKSTELDAELSKLLHVSPEFEVDDASVIITYKNKRLRLPKGHSAFDRPFTNGHPRAVREVESERHLANIHGTFYELPLVSNGAPPAWNLIRPVSSHSKKITDFCSWNGLLVLTGVRANATNDGHVFRDAKQNTALWFGGIDDLWKFGKPIGDGGPWRDTKVTSATPSDPYLMKGYDQKSVTMSHTSPEPVTLTLEIDLDGTGLWVRYQSFEVPPGSPVQYEFPVQFSAAWVRAVADRDTTATVQFEYR